MTDSERNPETTETREAADALNDLRRRLDDAVDRLIQGKAGKITWF